MIDTLYTLNTIPIRASVRDSILTNTSLSGGLNIDGIDSLNLVLSGAPSVNVVMPEQTDWAMIIGIATICVNVLVLFVTIWSNRRLQQHETAEIRTRTIQEVSIKKEAELFERLVGICNLLQAQYENDKNGDNCRFVQAISNDKIRDTINETQTFISKNSIHINDELEQISVDLLNIYSDNVSSMQVLDIESLDKINDLLDQYCDRYNKPYETWKTVILNRIRTIHKKGEADE